MSKEVKKLASPLQWRDHAVTSAPTDQAISHLIEIGELPREHPGVIQLGGAPHVSKAISSRLTDTAEVIGPSGNCELMIRPPARATASPSA